MTREEKNKLAQIVSFELCPNRQYCITNYGEKANCYSDNNFGECPTIMKVVDNLIKHEQDTLKEFVEWYKNKQKDILEKKQDLFWENENEYYAGQCDYIANDIICKINSDLEKFLEERK